MKVAPIGFCRTIREATTLNRVKKLVDRVTPMIESARKLAVRFLSWCGLTNRRAAAWVHL